MEVDPNSPEELAKDPYVRRAFAEGYFRPGVEVPRKYDVLAAGLGGTDVGFSGYAAGKALAGRGVQALGPFGMGLGVLLGAAEGAMNPGIGGYAMQKARHDFLMEESRLGNLTGYTDLYDKPQTFGLGSMSKAFWEKQRPAFQTLARTLSASAIDQYKAKAPEWAGGEPMEDGESYDRYFLRTGWRPDYNVSLGEAAHRLWRGPDYEALPGVIRRMQAEDKNLSTSDNPELETFFKLNKIDRIKDITDRLKRKDEEARRWKEDYQASIDAAFSL